MFLRTSLVFLKIPVCLYNSTMHSARFLFLYYWAGFVVAQRERAQGDFKGPHLTQPPIHVRKTATALGSATEELS